MYVMMQRMMIVSRNHAQYKFNNIYKHVCEYRLAGQTSAIWQMKII